MRKPHQTVAPEAIETIKNWQAGKEQKYGKNKIIPSQPRWFVSYPYIIALMAVLQVFSIIYGRKFVLYFGFNGSYGSVVLLPMVLYIFQIVSECYGWQYARQIVWCNFLVNLTSIFVCLLGNSFSFSPFNHSDLQNAYVVLMDTMWVSAAINCVCVFFSDFICSALMCWSRFYLQGRFTLIRIMVLHLLSELLLLVGGFISLKFNHYNSYNIIVMLSGAFAARTIIALILLPFARYIIWYIQNRVEKVVVFDYRKDFNPFKFGIDPSNSVQFNADSWAKINVGKIDIKKLGQAYSDEFFEEHERQIKERIEQNNKQH